MLTSITPLGERGRGNRWALTVAAYLTGSVLGGATTGLVLGGAGALLARAVGEPARLLVAALVCALAAAADVAALRGHRLPGGSRQVDEDWLTRYRGWVYGGAFGFQLGLGVVTIVTSAATYALLALAVLAGGVLPGLAVGVAFGLVRGLPVLALRRATTPQRLRATARQVATAAPPVARAAVAALAAAAAALLAGALLGGSAA